MAQFISNPKTHFAGSSFKSSSYAGSLHMQSQAFNEPSVNIPLRYSSSLKRSPSVRVPRRTNNLGYIGDMYAAHRSLDSMQSIAINTNTITVSKPQAVLTGATTRFQTNAPDDICAPQVSNLSPFAYESLYASMRKHGCFSMSSLLIEQTNSHTLRRMSLIATPSVTTIIKTRIVAAD
jgi:hypothetical protein